MGAAIFVLLVAAVIAAVPVAAILAGGGRPSRSSLTLLLVGSVTVFSLVVASLVLLATVQGR